MRGEGGMSIGVKQETTKKKFQNSAIDRMGSSILFHGKLMLKKK
jgi:hypothetical protein